jgi:hypothetical protein
MPSGIVFLVKFLFDVCRNILIDKSCTYLVITSRHTVNHTMDVKHDTNLLDVVLLKCLRGTVDSVLLHVL